MNDPKPPYRLYQKFELPWGYVVTIVQTDMPPDEGAHATWDVDTRTIHIDKTLTPAEKRGVLIHELEHAWADWRLWVVQHIPVKMPESADPNVEEPDDGTE